MAIILTVVESTSQIISGIPEYIVVETNIPAIIFYTFDGTDPTIDSSFMTDNTLYISTSQNTINVKILAISGADYSDIFEHEWGTIIPFYTKRFENTEGISILPSGAEVVDSLSVNSDGDPTRETSIEFEDLDMVASSRDIYKKYDGGKTSLDFINFKLEMLLSEPEQPYQSKSSSPNDNNIDFDPKAGLIIIDGSTQERLNSQSIKIINRPYNTMSTRSECYNEHIQSQSILTGNFVRHFVNPQTGTVVFYYFDSRECRWINSIQHITPKRLDLGQQVGNPRVFAWVSDPIMSKIF